jgi:hypothetical protein
MIHGQIELVCDRMANSSLVTNALHDGERHDGNLSRMESSLGLFVATATSNQQSAISNQQSAVSSQQSLQQHSDQRAELACFARDSHR